MQVGYLSFLWHTVRIKDFALDGPAVHLERLASGAVPLPGLRAAPAVAAGTAPTATTTGTAPVTEPAAGKPARTAWNIVVDQVALRAGRINIRDHVPDPPQSAELYQPHGVTARPDGSIYISDSSNNRILKIEP